MSNQGIIIRSAGDAKLVECSIPKLRNDYILVQVAAVALNPTDWKHVDFKNLSTPGARVGCDYAGTVLEVGSGVTKPFKKGDRVAGFAHGVNSLYLEDGAFAKIITAKGDIQMAIPHNLSFEEASTFPLGIFTVGQGIYQSLELPLPTRPLTSPLPLLIYGGSTATGVLAIQLAKLSGCTVVATCSPHNDAYVKSLSADAVFDYSSATCAADIKAYTKDSLAHVFDCISAGGTTRICVEALSSGGGTLTSLDPIPEDQVSEINVVNKSTLMYSVVGERCRIGSTELPAKREDFEFAKMFIELTAGLSAEGKVKVHKPSVNQGGKGLEGVLIGMQAMREGKLSGKKLVYTL